MAVDLVEKIARFHIMCAERLIEEEIYNFDKKLNDENLTKCIQTLKHMYYDMGIEGMAISIVKFLGVEIWDFTDVSLDISITSKSKKTNNLPLKSPLK